MKAAGELPSASFFSLLRVAPWHDTQFLLWKESDPLLALPPNTHQRRKKCSYLILISVSVASPWQKWGSRTQPPRLLSFTKSPGWHTPASSQAVLLPLCTPRCSLWPWKTLSNQPWLFHISSPAHCPCLYLYGCVWCFLEDSKSYRSS